MKTFREHLSEEIKIGALASGGIGIERDAVRDEINGILSGIGSQPCITPYGSLNRIRKALAYFSIFLPKKVYMEGRHGIEVWEIHQFGDKMGMTDQGEFIKSVPAKYYLFLHYHLIGSMYFLESKIVDDNELEERLSRAERMVAEGTDAACQQTMAKAVSPKEPMHDEDDDTVSTKKAVEVSMRRKDKKLSADSLEEAMTRKQKDRAVRSFMSHDPKAGESILDMGKKEREEKKSFASAEKEANKWQKHRLKEADSTNYSGYKGGGTFEPDNMNKDKTNYSGYKGGGAYDSDNATNKASSQVRTREQGTTPTRASMEEEQIDEVNVKQIKKDIDSGMSHDAVIGKHANKRTTNTDDIRKVIKQHAWDKRMKKEETQIDEGGMPASVIAHKQKLASMSDKEFAEKHGHKTEKQLRDMGARHGYGFDKATKTGSDHYVKRAASKQIDEVSLAKAAKTAILRNRGAERSAHASPYDYSPHIDVQRSKAGKTVDRIERKHGAGVAKRVSKAIDKDTDKVWRGEMEEAYGVYRKGGSIGEKPSKEPHKTFDSAEEAKSHAKGMNKQLSPGEKKYYRIKYHVKSIKEEEQIDEKAPPGAKYERMVKHIKAGYAKDGLTAKEKGIAFATAWKAKKKEKREKEQTGKKKTILVTKKGEEHAKQGGGVFRVRKDQYDPKKHNLASE